MPDRQPQRGRPIATSLDTSSYTTTYLRDKLGRLTQKTETLLGVQTVLDYTYDPAGRLETITIGGILTQGLTYDANGNRLSVAPGNPTPIASYDDQDRLTQHQGSYPPAGPRGPGLAR